MNRGFSLPIDFGQMNYVVPLYLQSRENITRMPDLDRAVQVSPGNLLVRTISGAAMAYANARVAVQRHDQLPASGFSKHGPTSQIGQTRLRWKAGSLRNVASLIAQGYGAK